MTLLEILLLVILSILLFIFFRLKSKNAQLTDNYNDLSKKHVSIEEKLEETRKEYYKLSKFKHVVDADEEAQRLIKEANEEIDRLRSTTVQELEALERHTNDEIDRLNTEAKQKLSALVLQKEEKEEEIKFLIKAAEEKAALVKVSATQKATEIIANAESRAREIAGEAYEIANKAKHYEGVAQAMKNIIEGYSDEYLKPTFSLLDDLADDYSFDEAGRELKVAREHTRTLIQTEAAATCDYAENRRRTTAINFVLDAFNGKVDSILSTVKKNNYGILEQKIKDAFSVVNFLGAAFRNARINKIYLDARLDELRWAVTVNELKAQEKEEQRRIREQIREEERAIREYEKAIRDTVKEEETIKKAIEKAQAAMLKANEEQKKKYENQLSDLQLKLQEAEEKNKRALSMAQLTKSGHVYIISNIGSFGEDVFKIGMTRRLEPLDRVRELGDASVPFSFDIHAMMYSEDAPKLELALHKVFLQNQVNKVNPRKEFFRIPISTIRQQIEELNIETKWTLTAEAREYRETLAIEKAMENDKRLKDEWTQHQLEDAGDSSFDENEEL